MIESPKQRTITQNKAMHLLFTHIAETLNEAGMDMRATLKPGILIDWDSRMVKEYLWRPIMKAKTGKESTTEMNTKDIDSIFEIINRALADKGLHVPFTSLEEVMFQQHENQSNKS